MHENLFLTASLLVLAPTGGDGDAKPRPAALTVGADREVRVLPMTSLTRPLIQDAPMPLGRALGSSSDEGETTVLDLAFPDVRRLFAQPAKAPTDLNRLIDDLRLIDGPAWEKEGAALQVLDDQLVGVHEKQVLDRVAARAEQLRLTVVPSLSLRCVVWDGEREPGPSLRALGREEAERLLSQAMAGARGPIVFVGSAQGRAGDQVHLGQHRSVRFQNDVSVEVATKAKIADPEVRALLLGNTLTCLPLVRADGKSLALFCLLSWRELGEAGIVAREFTGALARQIEVAAVDQVQTAFGAKLGHEGGLLFAPGGTTRPGLRLLLVVRRLDPLPETEGGPATVPVALLTGPAFTDSGLGGGGGEDPSNPPPAVRVRRVSHEHLIEMMRFASGGKEQLRLTSEGMHVSAHGPANEVAAAAEAARFLAHDSERAFLVEIVREAKRQDAADGAWTPLGAPIAMPCLADRFGFAVEGREQGFLGDYNVEIAEESEVSDPVADAILDGVQARVVVEPAGAQCQVRLWLIDRALHALRPVPAAGPDLGTIWCPDQSEASLTRGFLCKPGDTVELGEGPRRLLNGVLHRTRLSLRLYEL